MLGLASPYTEDGTGLRPVAYVFLILLCLCLFVPGIAALPPVDRDEPSFAQATKQMIETGNYVDIHYQDTTRYKKPIGIYWLQAASVRLLNGDHLKEIWAYRIPSLFGAIMSVLMTAALGSLLFGPRIGLCGAIMLAACAILNAEARLAKTDAVLLATITVAQYALARAFLGVGKSRMNAFVFWTALGAGFLVKGPIILLVLFSTLLWLRRSDRKLAWFGHLRPAIGIPYSLLLILPWFIAIILASNGSFVEQSAGHDMFAKIWQGQNRGKLPPGLYMLAFPAIFFPFSLIAVLAAPGAWRERTGEAVRFCLGWIIPTWIVFELSLTKLPHYILPTFPPIALLAAKALCDGFPTLDGKRDRWTIVAGVALWLAAGTGLAAGFALIPALIDGEWNVAQIAAGVVLVVAQSAALFALFQRRVFQSVALLLLAVFAFYATSFGHTLPGMKRLWASDAIAGFAESVRPCETYGLVTAYYNEPSLAFLGGTDSAFMLLGSQANARMQTDPCLVAVIDDNRLRDFLEGNPYAQFDMHYRGEMRAYNLGHGSWHHLFFYTRNKGFNP